MKAARRRINSGPTKNFFRLRTHNDNIIQSELLIVNVTGHMCVLCASASCGMMVVGIVCVEGQLQRGMNQSVTAWPNTE